MGHLSPWWKMYWSMLGYPVKESSAWACQMHFDLTVWLASCLAQAHVTWPQELRICLWSTANCQSSKHLPPKKGADSQDRTHASSWLHCTTFCLLDPNSLNQSEAYCFVWVTDVHILHAPQLICTWPEIGSRREHSRKETRCLRCLCKIVNCHLRTAHRISSILSSLACGPTPNLAANIGR